MCSCDCGCWCLLAPSQLPPCFCGALVPFAALFVVQNQLTHAFAALGAMPCCCRASSYGEQTLVLLRSLAEARGLDCRRYAETLWAAFGPGFDGYRWEHSLGACCL